MENHPIPQDITGFQFKLIGDMTLKQFAYLATGCVFGWISFSLPITYLIKLPFSFIFITFGVSFAFFSIEGRPVDTMIINYIRAIFSPTKYVYLRFSNITPTQNPNFSRGFAPAPSGIITGASHPKTKADQKEFDFFKMLSQLLNPVQTQTAPATGPRNPYIISAHQQGEEKKKDKPVPRFIEEPERPKIEVLVAQANVIEHQLEEAKEEEKKDQGTADFEGAHEKVLELEKTLNDTLSQKQSLERELFELKRQLEQQKKEVYAPSVATAPVKTTQNVRIIPKELGKSAGIPIAPEFPNVISGIIKDPRGNPLPNILVEVKDKEGNPVRAFKTNAIGQFSASTPLSNGSYTIEFEDPSATNKFDTVGFSAEGSVILPIEVISTDTREELRKSLFN